jgi:hypothetical protein
MDCAETRIELRCSPRAARRISLDSAELQADEAGDSLADLVTMAARLRAAR